MSFQAAYKKLNAAQKQAVDQLDGPVLVFAGPGTGKTQLLSIRVANILKNTDAAPGNILCLTYTDSAAHTMRERLVKYTGAVGYRVVVSTFHGLGNLIRAEYPDNFDLRQGIEPADETVQRQIINEIFAALPFDNPLRQKDYMGGFAFSKSASRRLGELKEAGLTPQDYKAFLNEQAKQYPAIEGIVDPVFNGPRLSRKQLGVYATLAEALGSLKAPSPLPPFRALSQILAAELQHALVADEIGGKTEFVQLFRAKFLRKGVDKKWHLPPLDLQFALAKVYEDYNALLRGRGYFDFSDLIIDLISTLKTDAGLRAELEERFQYILVDEFQDTNTAQFEIVRLLTSAAVHEGRPNLMVVGDDNQAIYKFQGADNSNVRRFLELYREPVMVSLDQNYRSSQSILDFAGAFISQSPGQTTQPAKKALRAVKRSDVAGLISMPVFETVLAEHAWVVSDLKARLAKGQNPAEVAVLARSNSKLDEFAACLDAAGIAFKSRKTQKVLKDPRIQELITIFRLLATQSTATGQFGDEYLPKILAFKFWGLAPISVWQVAQSAYSLRRPWLSVMRESTDPKVRQLAEFLIDLAVKAQAEPVEYLLQYLISKDSVHSGFYRHYFEGHSGSGASRPYLDFLSILNALVQAMREHRRGQPLNLNDFLEFVQSHETAGTSPEISHTMQTGVTPVNLATVHSAKGAEYEVVYILDVSENSWGKNFARGDIKLAANLPISPVSDSLEDVYRLLFVALTRAKHTLILTSHRLDQKNRPSLRFAGLNDFESTPVVPLSDQQLFEPIVTKLKPRPYPEDAAAYLRERTATYKMNVTALRNFLNVAQIEQGRGGPQYFLYKQILRYPELKTPGLAYGTAFHAALAFVSKEATHSSQLPKLSEVLTVFEQSLQRERLRPVDFKYALERGRALLPEFIKFYKARLLLPHRSEVDFGHEGIVVGQTLLSGKIDRIEINGSKAIVTDFKTSKSRLTPEKAWGYKLQLAFYKVLLRHSRQYAKYRVDKGVIVFSEPEGEKFATVEYELTDKDTARVEGLIAAVGARVRDLNFANPNISRTGLAAIKAFEAELLDRSTNQRDFLKS